MARDDENRSSVPSILRVIFGIIMIIVYVGMGILLLINYFGWGDGPWQILRWVGGVILVLYGIWRAIRQFWGIDSPM